MKLYLIRHAQSTNNIESCKGETPDPPLTGLGQRQAALLAEHLVNGLVPETPEREKKGYGITRLYCSAMLRALQTTKPVAQKLGIKPIVWSALHEQGGIFWQLEKEKKTPDHYGKNRTQIQMEFPDYRLPETISEDGWWRGGFENQEESWQRAGEVVQSISEWSESDERIALISHGGFMDLLLKTLLGQDHHVTYRHYHTGITCIDFSKDGCLHLLFLNRIEHLERLYRFAALFHD